MWRRLLIIFVAGAAAFALARVFGPAASQQRGVEQANAFRERTAAVLARDGRFAGVELSVSSHPALVVRGTVPDAAALDDLRRLTRPPEGARFGVKLLAIVSPAPSVEDINHHESRPGDHQVLGVVPHARVGPCL